MEIITEGKSNDFFTPDTTIININFINKDKNYEEVIKLGSKNVLSFINNILNKIEFEKNNLKTKNFVIREETKYNEITRKYEFDGYSFNQNAILKFDYDKEKINKFISKISKIDNPPVYQINFGLKNENDCKKQLIKKAYNDAFEQAKIIAEASGKELKECVKIDFKPNETSYISQSNINSDFMYAKSMSIRDTGIITNIFTPEDIEINECLYCLWKAE